MYFFITTDEDGAKSKRVEEIDQEKWAVKQKISKQKILE